MKKYLKNRSVIDSASVYFLVIYRNLCEKLTPFKYTSTKLALVADNSNNSIKSVN